MRRPVSLGLASQRSGLVSDARRKVRPLGCAGAVPVVPSQRHRTARPRFAARSDYLDVRIQAIEAVGHLRCAAPGARVVRPLVRVVAPAVRHSRPRLVPTRATKRRKRVTAAECGPPHCWVSRHAPPTSGGELGGNPRHAFTSRIPRPGLLCRRTTGCGPGHPHGHDLRPRHLRRWALHPGRHRHRHVTGAAGRTRRRDDGQRRLPAGVPATG